MASNRLAFYPCAINEAVTVGEFPRNFLWAMGLDKTGLVSTPDQDWVHPEAGAAFGRLRLRAQAEGFELCAASGYRDYHRQYSLFSQKALGQRPIKDDEGRTLEASLLTASARLHAILRFSALPGTSRHHWGTDFDVFDRASLPAGERLCLEPWEYSGSGHQAALARWLIERIAADDAEGFFLPYQQDSGGVAPERWHLSHRPSATGFRAALTPERLLDAWRGSALTAKARLPGPLPMLEVVEPALETLLERYVVD